MTDNIDDIKIVITEDFETIPEDTYEVVISDIKKTEAPVYKNPDAMETVYTFEFTVLSGEYEGRKLFRRIRPKLSLKPNPSNLYKVWKAVTGKEHAKDEFNDFHVSSLLNRTVKVITENTTKGDQTYTNIANFQYLKGSEDKITDKDIEEITKPVKK
jgi:hypothetical protein